MVQEMNNLAAEFARSSRPGLHIHSSKELAIVVCGWPNAADTAVYVIDGRYCSYARTELAYAGDEAFKKGLRRLRRWTASKKIAA